MADDAGFTRTLEDAAQQQQEMHGGAINATFQLALLAQHAHEYKERLRAELEDSARELESLERLNSIQERIYEQLACMQTTVRKQMRRLNSDAASSTKTTPKRKNKKQQQQRQERKEQQQQQQQQRPMTEAEMETP